jgi:ferredoxin-thioredoxin reductase catalytic subunit
LHPDPEFLQDLIEGLKKNWDTYGYPLCPCRVGSNNFELDRDIFCPCDYRDPDVQEFGCCFCALYVRKDLYEGKTPIQPIPERRPPEKQARAYATETSAATPIAGKKETVTTHTVLPVEVNKKLWYCRQCGYVVFREDPPYVCPICKAKKEMFAQIEIEAKG